jgi:hypothetical protein
MTQQYDNTNKGVLFANKDRDSDSKPNAKGSIDINGVEYWLSAWTNTDKNGNKYQKLSVQAKDKAQQQGIQQAQNAVNAPPEAQHFDDGIPF